MQNTTLYILWDESHIWGLIAWRTAVSMGLPYQLVKGKEIAHGVLSGKSPSLLLVPGGSARMKGQALGAKGRKAITRYVQEGGQYLGICGGAGLGLSHGEGLGLCPWQRATYTERFQHLVSGHVLAHCPPHALAPAGVQLGGHGTSVANTHTSPDTGPNPRTAKQLPLPLPVWWPGRFAPQPGSPVTVLATYDTPDHDLWLADLPLASLPPAVFGEWQDLYGVNMQPDFLQGQPCVIHGAYGAGTYTLSYSHLETPNSPAANAWLAQLLRQLAGFEPRTTHTPPWPVEDQDPVWPYNDDTRPLWEARQSLRHIMGLGLTHNLLFRRTEWLWGWRTGIPGAALNNLYAALHTVLALPPTEDAMACWYRHRAAFCRALPPFSQGAEGYLLAERLATTLHASLPDAVDRQGLKEQRTALFGPPMSGGGLYKELLDIADELIFLLA